MKEINNMFNLVEEFLETFQQKKAQRNVYKQMLDSFDMSVRDISSISNSGFTSLNQSKVAETLHEPNVKLVALRSKIQDLLKDQNFSQ
jgi:hypothetical protein